MDAAALQGRPASLVRTAESWQRAGHDGTAVDGSGCLTLEWTLPPAPASPPGGCGSRGLAVDRLCRVYRLGDGVVERLALGPTGDGVDYARLPEPVVFLGGTPEPTGVTGDFSVTAPGPALDPVGIAIDRHDRLFLADGAAGTVTVLDLWSRRVLRTIRLGTPEHPARRAVGLAAHGGTVYAVLAAPSGLASMSAVTEPEELPLPLDDVPAGTEPRRVTVLPDGAPVVLATDPTGESRLLSEGRTPLAVGGASDLVVDADGVVVVAPCAPAAPASSGERVLLRRFVPGPTGWRQDHPLDATGYDGGGLVLTRDGRIGYFTATGFRLAVVTPVAYAVHGTCTTYRLDSGTPRNTWGRVLLEAAVPDGTSVTIATATSDEPDAEPPVTGASHPVGPVHRRPGAVTPWWPRHPCYDTFEAPVMAPPGRFLWVTLTLTGNRRRTPRVHEARIEHQAHALLRRLPAVFAADPSQAEFLHRYLATLEGVLHDLDLRSRCRDLLVDPHGTPAEALDWLASFVGLVLDERWAEEARRQLVAEIVTLYRLRGTLWALGRYLQIFLAGDRASDPTSAAPRPVILEHFRLRGVGGAVLGDDPALASSAVVGAGFRVGGAVGELGTRPLDPSSTTTSTYATHAHRFTVLVPRPLDVQEEAVVRHVLETERPAHTVYDLCTVEAGLRVGHGAHLGISTLVGPSGAFERVVTGRTVLGRRSILGPPSSGTAVEAGRVGRTTRVG